jgi:hypothetical protein
MKPALESVQDHQDLPSSHEVGQPGREAILEELDRILNSRFFRSAMRSKQFLEYVVRHSLDGQAERLKERTIGAEVFHRPAGYATGDDPVVRVQAGEVRRRLDQYYQTLQDEPHVCIELVVGSYSPHFRWGLSPETAEVSPPLLNEVKADPPPEGHWVRRWLLAAFVLILVMIAGLAVQRFRLPVHKSALTEFWNPVLLSRQPVLICLAKPVAYRPVEEIYRRYSRKHPGSFQTEVDRTNTPLPLDPGEKLTWGDLFVYSDYGVAGGDVYAAVALSGLMGRFDKPTQLRVGSNYSFADLRNSPAVVVGGFNNKWTMQLTANLHYAFVEDHEKYMIREQTTGGQIWRTRLDEKGETGDDFGIVSRLVDSKTGQFTVTVAGIGPMGTQAAGELVSNAQHIEDGLRRAPAGWQNGNLELVVHTTVTDGVAGPPQVVAAYYW